MNQKIIHIFATLSLVGFFHVHAQDFMIQTWEWNYPERVGNNRICLFLGKQAQNIKKAGFTMAWIPPLSRGSGGRSSMGYDPVDLYDLGQFITPVRFGRRDQIDEMIDSFQVAGLDIVGDLVYNHRDAGRAEPNPAVGGWITNFNGTKLNSGDLPYPSDRYRVVLPIGGSTGRGAGDYFFKIRSASQDARFYAKGYEVIMTTSQAGFNGVVRNENEPNGGGDCGESFDSLGLGNRFVATIDGAGCGTDEIKVTLKSGDFDLTGDELVIRLTNTGVSGLGDYTDHVIYGLWDATNQREAVGDLVYETFTDFTNLPSGRGGMNWMNFKPNGNPTQLSGAQDEMIFFYDYDQSVQSTYDTLLEWTSWMFESVGITGMRVDAVKHFPASFLGDILDGLVAKNIFPRMVVGEFFDYNAGTLNDWVNQVNASMDPVTQQNLDVRIFDFALRPSLKDACDVFGYDARNIFNSSMVDQVGTSPFSVVTFADNHDFDNEGNLIQNDPILANAYLLTNNQIGIPSIFYPEFFSDDSSKLRALMTAHKRYIFGADNRDYLNRFNTPYSANYISGGASSSLIFQLSNQSFLDNEVIVVINFSGDVLQVDHEINMTHLNQGDTLTDIFSVSPNAFAVVSGSNQIYLEVPPRSFAVWIEGNKSNELISLDPITTSIRDKIENPLQLEVYPQPVTGELHIKVNESRSSRLILQLMDLNGRIVREAAHTVSVGAAEIQMDISSQPSGMYVLRVNLGDTYAVRRLMKQ